MPKQEPRRIGRAALRRESWGTSAKCGPATGNAASDACRVAGDRHCKARGGRDATTRAGVGCLREHRLIPNGMRIAVALEIRADRMRRRDPLSTTMSASAMLSTRNSSHDSRNIASRDAPRWVGNRPRTSDEGVQPKDWGQKLPYLTDTYKNELIRLRLCSCEEHGKKVVGCATSLSNCLNSI